MSVYIVTGKLGQGKTLSCIQRIMEYMQEGRAVASNLDLFTENYPNKRFKHRRILRLPDRPTRADLDAIGYGTDNQDEYDEAKFGALVLDECGSWFNTRTWQAPERAEINDWLRHSRKMGWDVYIIVQDISLLDKQAREALCEYTVYCHRIDKLRIPIVTFWLNLFKIKLKLPRIHVATVRYGDNPQGVVADRWVYRGNDVFKFYDTKQIFTESASGVFSYLDPWLMAGRYMKPRHWTDYLIPAIRLVIAAPAILCLVAAAMSSGRSPGDIARDWTRIRPSQYRRKSRNGALHSYRRFFTRAVITQVHLYKNA